MSTTQQPSSSTRADGRPVLRPGPAHPITVAPAERSVRVLVGGTVVADTARALVLTEASYPPALYVPREAVDAALLRPSATTSYCPYKGDCTYVDVVTPDGTVADAAWTYEQPYPDVAAIAGHLAFYPDRVVVEVSPPA